MKTLSAADRVRIAREVSRPVCREYIDAIFDDFLELAGDRKMGEDETIIGGIASFHGIPVTIIGQQKGKNLEENIKFRFGMPNPEGYRKAERLMMQAEKFKRPIITFIDTPGAYPGKDAEERGQGEAIASCIATMSRLSVPTISIVIGEGGSGGALAIGVSDVTIMLENSIFSILSPEGFASILWKDSSRWEEAAEAMKLTADELKRLGIADIVISEANKDGDMVGAHVIPQLVFRRVDEEIYQSLLPLLSLKGSSLVEKRYKKLRSIGRKTEKRGLWQESE